MFRLLRKKAMGKAEIITIHPYSVLTGIVVVKILKTTVQVIRFTAFLRR